jgi:hypothetical protein
LNGARKRLNEQKGTNGPQRFYFAKEVFVKDSSGFSKVKKIDWQGKEKTIWR